MADVKKYILEDKKQDYKAIGSYTATSPMMAAKKAAADGHKYIVLRMPDDPNICREYKTKVVTLNTPKIMMIGDTPMIITKEIEVSFFKITQGDDDENSKPKKKSSRK